MTVLFVNEYFYPFVHGGAEISVLELGKALVSRGVNVHLLTPNYGTISNENIQGISVHRYAFLKKLHHPSDILTPMWHFNPIFWAITIFSLIKISLKNKVNVIHCHGLYSLPPSVLVSRLLRIPLVVTFRDNQLLCNYGYCLTENQFGHSCNIRDYFLRDFSQYYQAKVKNRSAITLIIQTAQAINGRVRTNVLKLFPHFSQSRIVSSQAQKKTFAANGFNTEVIYNLYEFSKKYFNNMPLGKSILYATKMSKGKGLDILLVAFKKVIKKYSEASMIIVGGGDMEHYKELSQKLGIGEMIKFFGRKSPEEVMNIRRNILLEVAPSVYPESFGRTALEAISAGVPVVVTNRGGLPEIIENNKTGVVVEPNEKELARGILHCIKNNKIFRKNIKRQYSQLQKKFYDNPAEETIRVYETLCR